MPWATPPDFVAGVVVPESQLDALSALLTTGVARPLAEVVLAAPAATIDFSAIPATFRSLMILMQGRGDVAAANTALLMRFNNDSGAAKYGYQIGTFAGTSPAAAESVSTSGISMGQLVGATAPAGSPSAYSIFIPEYRGTTIQKTGIATGGYRVGAGSAQVIAFQAYGVWLDTAAINRVTLSLASGNFIAGSSAVLIGIPGLS